MNVACFEPSLTASLRSGARRAIALASMLVTASCSSNATLGRQEPVAAPAPDAPLVNADPGAWFDARGNLTIVGAGRRLRLVLSAPIAACGPRLEGGSGDAEQVASASLPYHVLSETCRESHPSILLAEEGNTASRAELEHSYHEVSRCAVTDFGLTDGWVPKLVEENDPCPLALGLGWRLPSVEQLEGLTLDDRKAVAGALFDPEDRSSTGALLLYARAPGGELRLVTLGPNAADRAPALDRDKRSLPLFGVGLRCVNDGAPESLRQPPPVLPQAPACLREKRKAAGRLASEPNTKPAPEVQALRRWLDAAERAPDLARDPRQVHELSALLASPDLERIALDARNERALTERYAELAEGLDDPAVPASERDRRRAEFEHLRHRLGNQIVDSVEKGGTDRTSLPALLARVSAVVEAAADPKVRSKTPKKPVIDFGPLLARLRTLNGKQPP